MNHTSFKPCYSNKTEDATTSTQLLRRRCSRTSNLHKIYLNREEDDLSYFHVFLLTYNKIFFSEIFPTSKSHRCRIIMSSSKSFKGTCKRNISIAWFSKPLSVNPNHIKNRVIIGRSMRQLLLKCDLENFHLARKIFSIIENKVKYFTRKYFPPPPSHLREHTLSKKKTLPRTYTYFRQPLWNLRLLSLNVSALSSINWIWFCNHGNVCQLMSNYE